MLLNFLNVSLAVSGLLHAAGGTPSSKTSTSSLCPGSQESLDSVKLVFNDARIPDDVKIEFQPQALLNIAWPSPDYETGPTYTYPGRHLRDNLTYTTPMFSATSLPNDKHGPFIILMFTPDVPATEKPSIRDFIGSDFYVTHGTGGALVNQTTPVANWRRPLPPRISQGQRYIFLMYDQPPTFDGPTSLGNTTFRNFDIVDYAVRNGLGDPVAGTFVYIESNASCWRDGCT
ncbi:hypothetical protein CVT24_009255 [Panaeolus cyanescens]|uniref:Uncharacterized protein n=1 Tax=Panaeolus cyanescens TaxID=181874 RepID=A0A409Y846_9AGAR|nr:hypothetical protein CVT24_009255 [Panaeolus cyanescens]